MTDLSLLEGIRSQRAIRRFTQRPVPEEAIATVIEAATRAPSPGNRQSWRFLVIHDPMLKRRLADFAWQATQEAKQANPQATPQQSAGPMYRAADDLARDLGRVPVLILACVEKRLQEAVSRGAITHGASIYPAVQNLMLAARALGLGTCLTTRYRRYEEDVKALLGIPESMETAALIPLGYPAKGEHFGGSRRKPVEEVTYYDRWGQGRA